MIEKNNYKTKKVHCVAIIPIALAHGVGSIQPCTHVAECDAVSDTGQRNYSTVMVRERFWEVKS